MMNKTEQVMPTRQGQIVVIFNPMPDEDPREQYMVADDPSPYPLDRKILLYSITEIQRTKHSGGVPFGTSVQIQDLHVVGEDLKTWVESWNYQIK
jgi:hypothetical protein